MLVLNGYPVTDFTTRDPGLPSVIKNGNPERIALYPIAHDDGSAGQLRNLATLTNATLSGGSTLLAQEKFRNDFQRLTSTFPTLGFKASPAWTNLLYALNADAPSFEGGTLHAGWGIALHLCTTANTTADAWHGSRSMLMTCTAPGNMRAYYSVEGATVAGNQYTGAAMFKGTAGKSYYALLYGNVSGETKGTAIVANGTWQLCSVTKTFNGADAIRRLYLFGGAAVAGNMVYWDAISLVAGATVPQFEEKECEATEAYFANPIPAGSPVSGVVFLWVPYNGNDGVEHNYLDCRDASGYGWRLYKSAANNLLIETTSAAGTKSMGGAVNGTNMAAGRLHAIGFAIHADNTQILALNGTLLTTSAGAAGREAAVNANLYMGSDKDALNHGNCVMLPFAYNVAWGDEECQYYSSLQAPPPRNRVVW